MKLSEIPYSDGITYIPFAESLNISYQLLFSKIYLHRRNAVPARKPVIIAANHPTAFIDPILFCVYFAPPVYNMTRGDIFAKPLFRKILMDFNMFPVFRKRDGYDSGDRNDGVFEFCRNKLKKNQLICIFVEGEHHSDRRVLPMQKGIARVAFGAYEADRMEELQIIPVGCSYDNNYKTRDEAKVIVGEPIFVKDYWETYQQSNGLGVNTLCKDIRSALQKICIHVENPEDDEAAEQILTLHRSMRQRSPWPVVQDNDGGFFEEKARIDRLNAMLPEEKAVLKAKLNAYFGKLQQAGISDEALVRPEQGAWYWILLFIAGALPAAMGYLLSWPVRKLARWVGKKAVKKREFYTSVLLGVGDLGGLIWALLLLITAWAMGSLLLAVAALTLPVWTWIFLVYRDIWQRWMAARKALPYEALSAERREIFEVV